MILSIDNIHVRYDPSLGEVLHGVSMEIEEGEVVSLIGPNGAGKSTTLRTIAGVLSPTEGNVSYKGEDICGLTPRETVQRGISLVPETRELFPNMTIKENLEVASYLTGNADFSQVYKIFPILEERSQQYARSLSGGEQQMLAVAQALMSDPDLLLLDEPSLGLAPQLVDEVFDVIDRLLSEGVTVLLVEQQAKKALQYSDRSYVIENGSIAFDGPSQKLLDDEDLYAAYLGQ